MGRSIQWALKMMLTALEMIKNTYKTIHPLRHESHGKIFSPHFSEDEPGYEASYHVSTIAYHDCTGCPWF